MAIIPRGNWSFLEPGDDIPDGSTVQNANLSQLAPDTAILVGKTLTFERCNLLNVRIDASWTIDDCNTSQVSFCTNVQPQLIAKGLAACPENCSHVIGIDEWMVDGQIIDTLYQYKHTVMT